MAARERWMETPVGWLRLVAEDGALTEVHMEDGAPPRADAGVPAGAPDAVLDEAERQLAAWFRGERTSFDVPLRGKGTDFQRAVWSALARIPYGETRSYAEVAAAIGAPAAVRAVGAANGRNPLPIVVPCHRVIGADGKLTGFGGGLPRKRWLLAHEREVLERQGRAAGGQKTLKLG